MPGIETEILRLIEKSQSILRKRQASDDPEGIEAGRVLKLLAPWPPLIGSFQKSEHPISAFAAAIKADADDADLLEAIIPVFEHLPWRYSYPYRADAPDLERRVAFAEVVGPEAPYRSKQVCMGFTLIAPWTLYPEHHHPAVELYRVISGKATWTLNGVSRVHRSGAFILHPSEAVHAMQTDAEPLLALYTWSGSNVITTSAYSI